MGLGTAIQASAIDQHQITYTTCTVSTASIVSTVFYTATAVVPFSRTLQTGPLTLPAHIPPSNHSTVVTHSTTAQALSVSQVHSSLAAAAVGGRGSSALEAGRTAGETAAIGGVVGERAGGDATVVEEEGRLTTEAQGRRGASETG